MDTMSSVPALWKPNGTPQRLVGLSVVKSIKLDPTSQGMYIQVRGASVYMTMDGATNPVVGGNDLGFELFITSLPILLVAPPGTEFRFLQTTTSAIIQYQQVTLVGR